MKQAIQNVAMALALAIALIGGIWTMYGVAVIFNMDTPTPAWEAIQLPENANE